MGFSNVKKRKRGARKTHYALRQAGETDSGQMTTSTSIGPSCKMFFPCDETAGATTLTDAAGDVVLTPSSIAFTVPNAVRMNHNSSGSSVAPTSGTIPDIGTDDFILFCVFGVNAGTARGEIIVNIGDRSGGDTDYYGFNDGDATSARRSPSNEFIVGVETNIGTAPGDTGAIGMIRSGDSVGTWMHNPVPDGMSDQVGVGDVFVRLSTESLRADGDANGGPYTGTISRNEYNLNVSDFPNNVESSTPDLGTIADSAPGLWGYLNPETAMPYANEIAIGTTLADIDYYGIALFQFTDGIPGDFKTALRWMHDEWLIGNKVIYPSWVSA